jgi:hypothetical protein
MRPTSRCRSRPDTERSRERRQGHFRSLRRFDVQRDHADAGSQAHLQGRAAERLARPMRAVYTGTLIAGDNADRLVGQLAPDAFARADGPGT